MSLVWADHSIVGEEVYILEVCNAEGLWYFKDIYSFYYKAHRDGMRWLKKKNDPKCEFRILTRYIL